MKNIIAVILTYALLISMPVSANTGKDIFDRYCTVCHSPSMAKMFNAPAAHDLHAWNERKEIALSKNIEINLTDENRDEEAIKKLVVSATNGTDNGMPPMGTCMDCTDNDLKAAITFMSSIEN
ncbi:MAG TPA: c-type cytochrome [Candidatus Azoamicus sp. OHIO2]